MAATQVAARCDVAVARVAAPTLLYALWLDVEAKSVTHVLVFSALLLLASVPTDALAQRGQTQARENAVRCISVDDRESLCRADTRLGVELLETIDGRCQLGRTWGYDASGIWVRGCSAEFAIGHRDGASGWGWDHQDGNRLTCASEDFRYALCAGYTRRGVRLVNQISRTECVEGRTWGFDQRGIWVDQGCAGEFELGASHEGTNNDVAAEPAAPGASFTCESRDGRRRHCAAELRGRAVVLIRTISRARCIEGETWGTDRDGLWVDDGCAGEFSVAQ